MKPKKQTKKLPLQVFRIRIHFYADPDLVASQALDPETDSEGTVPYVKNETRKTPQKMSNQSFTNSSRLKSCGGSFLLL